MQILSIIAATLVCILGGISSYSDIKYKKSFNRHIVVFLIAGIAVQIVSVAINPGQWVWTLSNIALTFIVSILFYSFRIWAAGDAKLFITMILLLPYQMYIHSVLSIFPALVILECVFLIALLYTIAESTVFAVIDFKKHGFAILKRFVPKITKSLVLSCLVTFFIIDTCDAILLCTHNPILLGNRQLFVIINLLIAVSIISMIDKSKWKPLIIAAFAVIRFALYFTTKATAPMLSIWSIGIIAVTIIVRNFTGQYNYRKIPVSQLQVGNVLSRASLIPMLPSLVKGLPKYTDETTRCRLTADEVDAIKRWEHSKYGQSHVVIVRTLPFAPFIFGGIILYFFFIFHWGIH